MWGNSTRPAQEIHVITQYVGKMRVSRLMKNSLPSCEQIIAIMKALRTKKMSTPNVPTVCHEPKEMPV
jgi:hypothetical protein